MKTVLDLSPEEVEAGKAELVARLGAEGETLPWLRRLALDDTTGRWLLSVREAKPANRPEYRDQPWIALFGPEIRVDHRPIDEAIVFVQGGGEREAERLGQLLSAHRAEEKRRDERREEESRRQHQRLLEDQKRAREWEEKRQRFDAAGWDKLPVWSQLLYQLALVEADARPDVTSRLREIAVLGTRGIHHPGGMPFPGVRWR